MARVSCGEFPPRPTPCNRTKRAALTPSGCWRFSRFRHPSRSSVVKMPTLRNGPCPSNSVKLQSLRLSSYNTLRLTNNGATGVSRACPERSRRVLQHGGRAGTPGSPLAGLTPVIRHGLGMNQNPEQFRRVVFEADLERCLNVVHSGKQHIVGKRAVTGNIKPRTHLLELEFVHVHHLGKLLHNILKPLFQF